MSPKHYRVASRPQTRFRRMRRGLAVAAVIGLGAAAAATLRQVPFQTLKTQLNLWSVPPSIPVSGLPQEVEGRVLPFLRAQAPETSVKDSVSALQNRFGFIGGVDVRRDWLARPKSFSVKLRQAVAVIEGKAKEPSYLGADGVVFEAPAAMERISAPVVSAGRVEAADLKALAGFLQDAGRSAAVFPSPLTKMEFVSSQDGWKAEFADGTTILWGNLDWTSEKIGRLRQVLSDAKSQSAGPFSLDMRYFADGRILLKPAKSHG